MQPLVEIEILSAILKALIIEDATTEIDYALQDYKVTSIRITVIYIKTYSIIIMNFSSTTILLEKR